MITVLVLVSLVALFGLCLPNLFRPMAPSASDPCSAPDPYGMPDPYPASEPYVSPDPGSVSDSGPAPELVPGPVSTDLPAVHPESMTAELDPGDEEYLACLADELWPDDEYLAPEPSNDGEEESGGSDARL
ncbi:MULTISPECIES: hypothetical protein [Actinomadura]|uniref:Uncharacterized protein n=1 Tax=Actinomadura litoris TaxID=2678616 RepID=A0A7K1L459_9ACTN|nr:MULTISPECIES: hypothetical protein [Actinomadura]MBT2210005.1 hypothetical protein [Actinomadura sp. NEAU-AAG7]MUN39170.1 hypothetical protein [Actinomadura litoris]